jgi:hypothetical protein
VSKRQHPGQRHGHGGGLFRAPRRGGSGHIAVQPTVHRRSRPGRQATTIALIRVAIRYGASAAFLATSEPPPSASEMSAGQGEPGMPSPGRSRSSIHSRR